MKNKFVETFNDNLPSLNDIQTRFKILASLHEMLTVIDFKDNLLMTIHSTI